MSRKIEKLKKLLKEADIELTEPIVADGEIHMTSNGYYMVDEKKPFVAFYGNLDGSEAKELTFRSKPPNSELDGKRDQKVAEMKKMCREVITADQRKNIEAEINCGAEVVVTSDASRSDVDEATVERLSKVSLFDYDRLRKKEALRLNIRVSTLDDAVKEIRKLSVSQVTLGPRLLEEINDIFISKNVDRISTNDLIKELCADKNKLWAVFHQGEHITPKQIAYLLKPYGIQSQDFRFGNSIAKGYSKESVSAAYLRNQADYVAQNQESQKADISA